MGELIHTVELVEESEMGEMLGSLRMGTLVMSGCHAIIV